MSVRRAVRGLLLTPAGEILLLKLREPVTKAEFWITPGGGLDGGEDPEAGVRREVREETGYAGAPGPPVWERRCAFTWNGRVLDQFETYYVFRVPGRFEPAMTPAADSTEHETLLEFRWWTAAEISESSDTFAPRGLGDLLNLLRVQGAPGRPIAI